MCTTLRVHLGLTRSFHFLLMQASITYEVTAFLLQLIDIELPPLILTSSSSILRSFRPEALLLDKTIPKIQ